MKRVLVTGATNIGKAGVATIVYKWGQQFENDKLVYDYLMQRGLPDKVYQDAIYSKGGKIYTMEHYGSMLSIIKWVENIIKENKYETIHINSDSAYIAAAYILAAKRGKIKNIYVHSHCTQIDENVFFKRLIKTIFHKLCISYVKKNTKVRLACSEVAGKWMFGDINKNYKTIYNGVEFEKYNFNAELRKQKRKKLKIQNEFIIGNIGRLSYQKNQDFLIDIFVEFHKKNSNSKLLIVGDGELKGKIEEKIVKAGLENSIILLGQRSDIPELLWTFDVMIMPSRFEGLPVTMVEAQMASLPLIVSSNITKEADFTGNVQFIDGWDSRIWVDAIEKILKKERISNEDCLSSSVFNVKNATIELQNILLGEKL